MPIMQKLGPDELKGKEQLKQTAISALQKATRTFGVSLTRNEMIKVANQVLKGTKSKTGFNSRTRSILFRHLVKRNKSEALRVEFKTCYKRKFRKLSEEKQNQIIQNAIKVGMKKSYGHGSQYYRDIYKAYSRAASRKIVKTQVIKFKPMEIKTKKQESDMWGTDETGIPVATIGKIIGISSTEVSRIGKIIGISSTEVRRIENNTIATKELKTTYRAVSELHYPDASRNHLRYIISRYSSASTELVKALKSYRNFVEQNGRHMDQWSGTIYRGHRDAFNNAFRSGVSIPKFLDTLGTVLQNNLANNRTYQTLLNVSYGVSVLGKKDAGILQEARGIKIFCRYSAKVLKEQLKQVKYGIKSKKPDLYVFYPHADHNGTFYSAAKKFRKLSKQFNLIVREVSTENEIYSAVDRIKKKSNILIGGHGDATAIQLGDGKGEKYTLDLSDAKELKRHFKGKVSTVMLEACEAGKKLRNMIKNTANADQVLASDQNGEIGDIIAINGEIKGVTYVKAH